jgi:hypothetical protein
MIDFSISSGLSQFSYLFLRWKISMARLWWRLEPGKKYANAKTLQGRSLTMGCCNGRFVV